jgi:hypothetical protein
LLRENTWNLLVRIGEHGFESADAAGAFTALVCLTTGKPSTSHKLSTLDLSQIDSPRKKALELHSQNVRQIDQTTFLSNPQHIVSLDLSQTPNCLKNYAIMAEGLSRGDVGRYDRYFWETTFPNKDWQYLLNAPIDPAPPYGGRESVFLWENGCGSLSNNPSARIQGQACQIAQVESDTHKRSYPRTKWCCDCSKGRFTPCSNLVILLIFRIQQCCKKVNSEDFDSNWNASQCSL